MGLLSAKQEQEVMAEINITPLTDVLLVLLIIFMILATLVTPPGFEKQLSNKSNVQVEKQHQDINVTVNDRGVIYVDGTKATAQTIYYVMGEAAKRKPNHHVSLIADAKAQYGIIIRILDAARLAGLEDVGFVTS